MKYWVATFKDTIHEFEADTFEDLLDDIIEDYTDTDRLPDLINDIILMKEDGSSISYKSLVGEAQLFIDIQVTNNLAQRRHERADIAADTQSYYKGLL